MGVTTTVRFLNARGVRWGLILGALVALLFAGPREWPGAPQPALANSTFTALTASTASVTVGQVVTFRAEVTCPPSGPFDLIPPSPTGTVTFRNTSTGAILGTATTFPHSGSTYAATLNATFANDNLFGSVYSITASYESNGSGCDPSTSAPVSVTVNAGSSTTYLFLQSADTGYIGIEPLFGVRVTGGGPVPTGSVALVDDTGSGPVVIASVPLEDGVADLRTPPLGPGTHQIRAVYYPNTFNYRSSESGPQAIEVLKYPTEVTFATFPTGPVGANASTQIGVRLANPPGFGNVVEPRTGAVQLKVDGVTVATSTLSGAFVNGEVLFTVSLEEGTRSLTATYSGDDNFASSATSAARTVEVAPQIATEVFFAGFPSSPMLQAPTTHISIGVRSLGSGRPGRGGTLVLRLNGTQVSSTTFDPSLVSGYVSVTATLTNLPAGDHVLTATYSGDANYAGGSVSRSLTVRAPATGLAITTRSNIVVDGSATGSTIFYLGPTASDSDGPVPVTCTPASGYRFPVGVTTVTCTATNPFAVPSTVSSTFTVTVNYGGLTIAPGSNVTATATSPAGAVVHFPLPVASNVNGPVTVTCVPAPGSLFPVGLSLVVCTANATGVYPNYAVTTVLVSVLADTTPPVVTPEVSGLLGNDGWYRGDVTVAWSVEDPESAITSSSGCATSTVTSDTAGTTFTCVATSAGGSTTQSVTVKRDASPPVASATRSPEAHAAGWNNTEVTVTFSGTDDTSGVASCTAPAVVGEGGGQSATGTCTDVAGNVSAPVSVTDINVDLSAAVVTVTVSAAPDASGWYTSPVTVQFTCSDTGGSGLAPGSCPDDLLVDSDGTTTIPSYTVTDLAGNVSAATEVIVLHVDRVAPSTTAMAAPAPNGNGWNNTAVTVTFSGTDATSGDVSCDAPVTLGEGAGQSVSGTCTDVAGNESEPASVMGINVDLTAPEVTLTGAVDGATYTASAAPTPVCTSVDALSGIATAATLTVSGSLATVTATCAGAVDRAGNVGPVISVTYTVTYAFCGFAQPLLVPVQQFKSGSTIPVKFCLRDAFGAPVTTATGVVEAYVNGVLQGTEAIRYTGGQYIANVQTKSGRTNWPTGTLELRVVLNDGSVHVKDGLRLR